MNEYEYTFQKEFHEHIVHHVFLTRRLPSFQTKEIETHELHILELMKSIVSISELELPFSTIKMIKVLSNQNGSNANSFYFNLTRLKPGDMIGFYVRKQNCSILVYRPKNNNSNDVFLSTIQASLEKVYEGEGDIQVDYPTRVVRVPFSKVLKSRVCFQQLCTLNGRRMDRPTESETSIDDKKVPSTKYVSQWLLAVLSNETSDIVSSEEFPTISKKYRDDVIWNNSDDLPFRRSGLWIAVKAMLQVNLTIEYGPQCGEFVYKLLMIKYMAEIVKFYADEQYNSLDADLVMQMLAKIARRIDKLAEYLKNCQSIPTYPDNVERKTTVVELFYKVKADAVCTIEVVREKLQNEFIKWQQEDYQNRVLEELEDIKFSNHINQQVPKLHEYIAKRMSKESEVVNVKQDVKLNGLKLYRHSLEKKELPDIQVLKSTTGEINTNLLLSDIEIWIIRKLDVSKATNEGEALRALAIAYQEKASQFYNDDPIGSSRMMLVMLKIIFILDSLAVRKYPLLREHGSCINPLIIDDLILPQQSDLKVAFELQQHFQSRNRNAKYKGLIEHDEINDTSFSARYARYDLEMNAKRKEIIRMIETKIEEKRADWLSVRQRAAKLRREFAATACEYRRDDYGKRVHTQGCSHCKLSNSINRLKVEVYERPLRHEEFNQSAVVFELMIPSEIEYLRDVLFIFMHRCCLTEPKTNDMSNTKVNAKTTNGTKWTENSQLVDYAKGTSQLVFLSSSAKPKKGARNRRYLHPDEPIERFIVDNESNCIFFGSAENRVRLPINFEKQSVKKFCTFKVESNSPYKNLQWTVDGTQHFQNNVLAKQSACHRDLSLAEYISFGSLRADGHRLQLRNLYRAIETDSLSFQNKSVMLLILAALWEAGPNKDNTWQRESHEDFSNHDFVNAMADSIFKFMQQQESNWKHPRKLQTAVLITARFFEMNQDEKIADRLAQLLVYSRRIAMDWIEQIIQARGELIDQNEDKILLDNLVDVAICGGLTFFVDCNHKFFEKIFGYSGQHSALFAWLTFIVIISNNTILGAYGLNKIDADRKMFLRVVRNIGIDILAKMMRLGLAQPNWMNEFTHSQWSESKSGKFDRWKIYKGFEQEAVVAVTIDSRLSYVQIDLITGRFLVNGLPVSRLPEEITVHELFQRLFGDKVFEVQPAHQRFCSLYKFNKCIYSFELNDDELIITEQHDNGQQSELIPHHILTEEMPYLLVGNHSHWWNKIDQTIDFRPKEFNSSTMLSHQVEYCLHMKSRLLTEVKTKRCMVDILSSAFRSITNYLSRLESANYIHILLDEKMEAKIELVRMNLKFFIDKDNNVVSNEFNGMQISQSQAFGTLFGLRNGILLERAEYGSVEGTKMIILPHGDTLTASDPYDHTGNVLIDVHAPLRSPPFFIYHVDDNCKLIKTDSGYPAWFFLAYMHAMTTYPLPDPFTEMTGTERALQILQSGFSWSPDPYDPESIITLNKIGEMSPVRKFHQKSSKCIQETVWPDCIPYYSPHDAFKIITTKLIKDSERLKPLYGKKDESKAESKEDKSEPNLSLNERAYFRILPYSPNAAITNLFIDHEKGNEVSHWIYNDRDENVDNIRILSALYSQESFSVPENSQNLIFDLLVIERELYGFGHDKIPKNQEIIEFCHANSIRNVFILLFEIARKKLLSREEIIIILSLFAREGADLRYLLCIQTVAENQTEFRDKSWDASQFTYHGQPQKYKFDRSEVLQQIQKQQIGVTQFLSQREHLPGFEQMKESFIDVYQNEVERASIELTNKIGSLWPLDDVSTIEMIQSSSELILFDARPIGRMLKAWNQNRKLVEFIDRLEKKFQSLTESGIEIPTIQTWTNPLRTKKQFRKFVPNLDEKMCRQFDDFAEDIERAEAIFNQPTSSLQLTESIDEWWNRFIRISVPTSELYLQKAGLFARLVPSTLFPKILQPINEQQRSLIGSLAVLTTFEQRKSRITRFERQQDMEIAALRHETENPPHMNWTPNEYPEWLLFEIEMNLSIRKIQVEVARRMIDPPGGVHSVMQLNMGEGKTAVIVPILAASLANGDQLCQITVLKSLYQTNIKSIRKCLGGMLNRRIYTFPCRRDLALDDHLSTIQSLYEECKELKGVVVTLPEYRLSFQLKMYESALKCTAVDKPSEFIATYEWLNANVRNILDESDAILHAKYQLVYTVGEQLPPDGGALRWTIVQAVLHTIPHQMYKLWTNSNAAGTVEFNENYMINGKSYGHGSVENRPDVFRPCRIIDNSQDTYNELKKAIAEDFIDGNLHISIPEMNAIVKNNVLNLLLNTDATPAHYEECLRYFNETARNTIYILAGLLKYEVLKLALTKRWRVNYGVNLNGYRKMAVPFKAKDVAAERTEFGHPDVAICVTQLSYYYSGLSDSQLQETFKALQLNQNYNEIYDEWLRCVPTNDVQESVRNLNGVNLVDSKQRDVYLFPILRYNMYVIDFWLASCVFPREAKTFAGKMMCTAWELSSEKLSKVSTGFSGTNDTKTLLPLPVHQNDLVELEETNENVRRILLLKENENYKRLEANISGCGIIHELVKSKTSVLLDSGALMLELSNEQVAKTWLNLVSSSEFDAAIYFNEQDILQSIDRNHLVTEFDYSVYREKLDRCLVYLDDSHTRGTDLKFPRGTKAFVTLSGGITRDKTVQACMRMRLLGQGHTIAFWASHEAHLGICNVSGKSKIRTEDVIQYITYNSRKFEKEGLVHWAAASVNYTQKIVSEFAFQKSVANTESLQLLSKRCSDDEFTPLTMMYGAKETLFVTEITRRRFNQLGQIYVTDPDALAFVQSVGDSVVTKLELEIPEMKRYAQLLDEEQEKELEHELEEQRENNRPPPAVPMKPRIISNSWRNLIRNGVDDNAFEQLKQNGELIPLSHALSNTQLWEKARIEIDSWGGNIFVSKDFVSVVHGEKHDSFLRPVWWICKLCAVPDVLLIISPFECNALISQIRNSRNAILLMYSPRLSQTQSSLLNRKGLRVTVKSNATVENVSPLNEAQLALFAGSMYFQTNQEQLTYSNFMGIIPRPRTKEQNEYFNKGIISSSGFVEQKNRRHFENLSAVCTFNRNPDALAVGIIERRHGYIRKRSDVCLLVNEAKRRRISVDIDDV